MDHDRCDHDERVLLVALTATDGKTSHRILAEAGILCAVCADLEAFCAELPAGAGVAVLPEEVFASESAVSFVTLLTAQPAWSDLPVIVLTQNGMDGPISDYVLEHLSNVMLVDRPVRIKTLISALRVALRGRRRQYQLREHLAERKRAEEDLKRQTEILQTIFDHIPLVICLTDSTAGIKMVNRQWHEMLGWTMEEARNRNILAEFYPDPADRQRVLEFIGQASGKWADFKVRVRDGRILDISWANIRLSDGMSIGIGQDVTDRKRQEQAREAYASRLQALSRRLVEVQEQERRHLARELHDEIGQTLTGLGMLLRVNDDLCADVVKTRCEQGRGLVGEVLERVRGLSFDLRPAELDQLGLVAALISLFERYTHQTEVRVHFEHHQMNKRIASEVATTAYRIVQGALTNVARHAGVMDVTVRAWTTAAELSVQIEDGGRGFDRDVVAPSGASGLVGMQERVELLDGHLSVDAAPGLGTRITAGLPLPRPSQSDDNGHSAFIGPTTIRSYFVK
jgi:PAS domain S-box-containing protein